jgi:hypothetical protein
MQVMVVRNVNVKPECVGEFMKYSLDAVKKTQNAIGVKPDVFVRQDHSGAGFDFRIFTEFDSMAQYETVFLEGLLKNGTYLDIAERGVSLVTAEPRDELLVRLSPDDFFMVRKSERIEYDFEQKKRNVSSPRYRREFELCAEKGRLREVMRDCFDVMERFTALTDIPPDLYCTRFTAGRIGSVRMYLDYDDCPVCDGLYFHLNEKYASSMKTALLSPPSNTLFLRVTDKLASFSEFDFASAPHAADQPLEVESQAFAGVNS